MYEVLKEDALNKLSVEWQLQLFDKIVKPIFLHGSEIWGFSKNIDCLEKIQLRFCKLLLNLKSSTPNYMIYGGLGRFPIETDITIRMVFFGARLLLGKETNLSYLSYKLLTKISSIKLRLQDQFKQDWYSLIGHFPKASNYRIFK